MVGMKGLGMVVVAVAALSLPAAARAEVAGDWKLDTAHSSIGFVARHLGLSKVRGQFKDYDATVKADSKTGEVVSVKATAKTASIDTGIKDRDDHLRSDDFFNAEKFPTLSLESKSIKYDGDTVTMVADVTMRDQTRSVTFTGERLGFQTVDFGGGPQHRAGYHLQAKVSRKDFGLKFGRLVDGVSVVSDDVMLEIEVQFYRPAKVSAAKAK